MSKILEIMGNISDDINNSVNNATGSDAPTVWQVVQPIILTVTFIAGIVAVVAVILGGIQYSTSQGDAGKVKKAKDTIMYGIIGLVVVIMAFAIVGFILGQVE